MGLSTSEQQTYINVPQYSDINDTPIEWDTINATEDEAKRSPPPKRMRISTPDARPFTITGDISDNEYEEPTHKLPLLAITEGCTTPTFDSPLSPSMTEVNSPLYIYISSIGTPLQDEARDEVISTATTVVTLRMFRHEEILRDGRVARETAIEHTEDVSH